MHSLPSLLLALTLSGPALAQTSPDSSALLQTSATVQAPAQPGWRVVQQDDDQVVFARDDAAGRARAQLRTVPLLATEPDCTQAATST